MCQVFLHFIASPHCSWIEMACSCARAATPSFCLRWHICTPLRQIPPHSLLSDPFSRQIPTHVEVFQRDVDPKRQSQRPTSTALVPSHCGQGPSILSTCLPSQKVGALQFLRAPAGDGIKEPTVEVAEAGGSPVSKRRQHAVCAASTRLKIMYNSPTYIYAHRLPETSRVSRRNGKKKQKKVSSKDQTTPSVVATETPQLRRFSKGIFFKPPHRRMYMPIRIVYRGKSVNGQERPWSKEKLDAS